MRGVSTVIADRGGATAVEFSLIAPALLLLLFGIAEVGRLLWTQSALHFAVEEAARCAAVDATNCASAAAVQRFAVARAAGLGLQNSVFSLAKPACGTEVSASYAFSFVTSALFPYSVTLTARSCFPQ